MQAHFDGRVQDCSNSIAKTLESVPSWTEPSILLQILTFEIVSLINRS